MVAKVGPIVTRKEVVVRGSQESEDGEGSGSERVSDTDENEERSGSESGSEKSEEEEKVV